MAIIAGVVLSVAAIFMAVYYQQHNAIGKDYRLKCEQESLPSSTTASLVCKIESINETEQGKPALQWWNILIAWPEGITAWLILGTLGAIVWQSWGTWKAAKAAGTAAEGAKESGEAFINVERAWLEVTMGTAILSAEGLDPHKQRIALVPTVINQGRTPSRLTKMYLRAHLCELGKELPEHPSYSLDAEGSAFFEGEILMVPKVGRSPLSIDIGAEEIGWIFTGLDFYLYGYVEYEISAAPRHTVRSTHFIFIYDVADPYSATTEGFNMPTGKRLRLYNRAT